MHFLWYASFAEYPDTQEGGFQKESHQGFDGQRRAENVANVARIFRPVHAKLEFLDDARDNADGEVDQKQLAPELGQHAPGFIPGLVVSCLKISDKPPQSQGERDEQKVVHSRQTELPS